MRTSGIEPSKWYYGLAILIAFLGSLGASYVFLRDFAYFEKSRHRVIVPGEHLVELSTPGNYTIFHEYHSVVGNRIFSTSPELISNLKCLLFDKNGTEISLVPRLGNERYYSSKGPAGVSLFNFKIHEPGTYVLKVSYEGGGEKPEIVLAVAEGFTGRTLCTIGIMGVILILTMGFAGYIAYKTFAKRRQSIKSIKNKGL